MMLITKAMEKQLKNNDLANTDADGIYKEDTIDHKPVVKFFNPCGAGTWLFTEMQQDGDTLFGLCDPGMGSPELGYASLSEIKATRLPFGLSIERDTSFEADKTISEYTEEARDLGRLEA